MKKVCLIFNPVSGSGNAPQELEQIRAKLAEQVDLDIRFTKPDQNPSAIAKAAIQSGTELIIASGGDGTISQIAAALLQTDIPLGVIPRGTANAFAAALEIPNDIEAACDVILTGQSQKIDYAICNGQPMILLAGIGLEATTISETPRENKQKFGFFAYLSNALQQLQNLQPFAAMFTFNNQQQHFTNVLAITIANLAPNTSILAQGTEKISSNDGLLDITILTLAEEGEILGLLSASYELFQSALQENSAEHPHIYSFRAAELTIQTDSEKQLLIDGELCGQTPAQFTTIPAGLWVQLPQDSDY